MLLYIVHTEALPPTSRIELKGLEVLKSCILQLSASELSVQGIKWKQVERSFTDTLTRLW